MLLLYKNLAKEGNESLAFSLLSAARFYTKIVKIFHIRKYLRNFIHFKIHFLMLSLPDTNTVPIVPATMVGNAFNAFNVMIRKDVSLQSFVKDTIAAHNCSWSVIRGLFAGTDNVTLTIVEKSVDTPFRCFLLACFCKQLQDELGVSFSRIHIKMAPVKDVPYTTDNGCIVSSSMSLDKTKPFPCTIPANIKFDTTFHRDIYLAMCFKREKDLTDNVKVSRFSLRCRDIVISNGIHSVIIRSGESFTDDWEVRTPGYHPWTTYIHDIPQEKMMCSHRQVRSEGKRGLLLSVELDASIQ